MRILLIAPSLFMPWATYTTRALERLGQSVSVFYSTSLSLDRFTLRRARSLAPTLPGLTEWLDRWRSHWHEARDQRLLRTVAKIRPNLILVLWGHSLSVNVVQSMKALARCPLLTWWLDDPFRKPVKDLLPLYDIFFIFDRSYMARLRAEGAPNVQFLPCASDENIYRPQVLSRMEKKRYACDVALVAWYYPKRAEMARALCDLDLSIWGRGWTSGEARRLLLPAQRLIVRSSRFIPDTVAARIYSAAKICLNIHSDQTHEAGLNLRTFEVLATGAFQLMDAVPGMEELLEPQQEIAAYHSPEEAKDLAEYYLRHPDERARIAQRGRARVLKEHTYVHRMRSLLRAAHP